jgi:phage minor structural protein
MSSIVGPFMGGAVIILDAQDRAVAVLSNEQGGIDAAPCRFWDDVHTEDLAGVLTYDFTCEATHADSVFVTDNAPILIRNDDGDLRYLRIVTIDDVRAGEARYKVVHAENAAQELNGRIVRQQFFSAQTPAAVAASLLAGTRWEVGDVDWAGGVDIEYRELPNVMEATHTLAEASALEVRWRVEFNGSVITHRYLDLVTRIGSDRGVAFDYGKNLVGVKRTSDSTGIVTRMIGAGKSDATGVYVTFAGMTWSTPGDPANKAAGLDYLQDDEAVQRWGVIEGVHNDPDMASAESLIHATWKALQAAKDPALTYEVDPVLLEHVYAQQPGGGDFPYEGERVRLGDTVHVRDTTFKPPLLTSQRVTEVKRGYASSTPTVGAA